MRDQLSKPDSSSSKKLGPLVAAIGSQCTAYYYFLQRRLLFTLLGTLIAIFSVALFLGGDAHAQGIRDTGQPAPTLDTAGNGSGGARAPVGGGGGATHDANAPAGGGRAIAPLQEKTAPLKQQTAPTQDLRSAPQSDPVYGQTAPAQEQITPVRQEPTPLKEQAQPVYDQASLLQGRPGPVQEQVTEPIQQTAEPAMGTVGQRTNRVVEPVQRQVKPIAEPVKQTVKPVLGPVKDTVDPVVKPVIDPVKDRVDPVVKPLTDPVKETGDPDPVAAAAPGHPNESVLRDQGSPGVSPVLEEGGADLAPTAPVDSSAIAAAKSVSPGASSGAALASSLLLVSNVEGSFSNGLMGDQQILLTPTTGGRPAIAPHFSVGELSSTLADFATTTVNGMSNQLPPSLPFSGALQVAGNAPGGSAPSSSGAGPDLGGVLTLLLIVLLGGKFLWYSRQFLKPNSAFQLLINEPG